MATDVAEKSAKAEGETGDPVADLRAGWRMHVEFGLANPELFALLAVPQRRHDSRAFEAGVRVLQRRVQRLAEAGLLRVDQQRAIDLISAAGTGAVLTMLGMPAGRRDLGLADQLFEAISATILTDAPAAAESGDRALTVAFATVVPELPALTDLEKALLSEWLTRSITAQRDA